MPAISKLILLFLILACASCGVFKEDSSVHDLPDGEYRSKVFAKAKVYVENRGDSIVVHKLSKVNGDFVADTIKPFVKIFVCKTNEKVNTQYYHSLSFDLDALTIPFKYRPETKSLPQQFTTSLNGAAYLGIRKDFYRIKYSKHFFNYYERESHHYAISLGGFTGFGSTAMNPWVTDYNINSEYEGVVWLKGAALIMAVGKYTSGVSIAWDNLLDKNSKYWIYERKPWIGLVFGLNLN
ncbi:hypothetical protein CNR22_07685 [Sphingobacteriaceae bacterium]|nr:hypothetical protein CNR22_07685 [Sphingobacteriaceae bacterium]